MINKFTIKNLCKCWLKMWPMTLILIAVGVGVGIFAAQRLTQSYTSTMSVLVINSSESALPTDYSGIVNSDLIASRAFERSGVASGKCTLTAVSSGNILNITTDCPEGGNESKDLVESAVSVFSDVVSELYGEENISVATLSGSTGVAPVQTDGDYVLRTVAPIVAGLLLSGVIAFVRLDYAVSKRKKK